MRTQMMDQPHGGKDFNHFMMKLNFTTIEMFKATGNKMKTTSMFSNQFENDIQDNKYYVKTLILC